MGKPKILLVEDEQDASKVMSINLEIVGMDVIVAYDGPTALEKISECKPDCVVLDIRLPQISGWEILEYIKANPATADIPVVMVTAQIGERDQLRGLGAGAVKYLTKPFSPVALTDTVKSVLRPQAKEKVARERRETIERLQLSTIYKISDILISAPVLDDLLEGVADKLIDLFELPCCAFMLTDAEEPEVYAFRQNSGRPAKGRTVSRSSLAPDAVTALKEAFATNRRPKRVSELDGFRLELVFPSLALAEDGYVLPLFERIMFLGCIVIAGRADVTLSTDETDLLVTIANQVAAAVARARLHDNLREDEIVHRRLLHQTITAQESERRRLAAEIHDGVVQSIVGISYKLQAIQKKIAPGTNGTLLDDLKVLGEQLNQNIKELRDLLLGLRPPMLDDMGLYAALETHLKNFAMSNKIKATLQMPEDKPVISRDAQMNLFRLIQEALNNIEKHAGASQVIIEIETTPQKLRLRISDDGSGFSPQKARGKTRNLGIASMRERTELLGGNLKIKSEPGHGTNITCDVPLEPILEVVSCPR
jgi:signal transduction histidine kinase/FixJ family two-component response regulator